MRLHPLSRSLVETHPRASWTRAFERAPHSGGPGATGASTAGTVYLSLAEALQGKRVEVTIAASIFAKHLPRQAGALRYSLNLVAETPLDDRESISDHEQKLQETLEGNPALAKEIGELLQPRPKPAAPPPEAPRPAPRMETPRPAPARSGVSLPKPASASARSEARQPAPAPAAAQREAHAVPAPAKQPAPAVVQKAAPRVGEPTAKEDAGGVLTRLEANMAQAATKGWQATAEELVGSYEYAIRLLRWGMDQQDRRIKAEEALRQRERQWTQAGEERGIEHENENARPVSNIYFLVASVLVAALLAVGIALMLKSRRPIEAVPVIPAEVQPAPPSEPRPSPPIFPSETSR